ncbi:MAG: DoxX family protein [Chitinophagales bacterium]|jgi:putative oxidoreductase|nr:DoxX family protein [Chitinophagales bacterium]MCZ2281726.1 DoxX family protein [Bacteroidales bacterium]OJV27269.1 MAG: DoxX family protein [Bacteroidetes bacterium 37-13]
MIKNIFNPGNYSKNIDFVLLLLRLVVGGFMLTHGIGKFEKLFSGEPITFPDPIGVGATASLALVVFSEVFCSLFLIFGIATRLSSIPLIITMLVAAFIAHAADGFGKQELPLLYTVIYIVLVISGSGRIAFDNWMYQKLS